MFEDSLFESSGRIRKASRSKYWMILTFCTNGSILLLLILIPLIYPEALPAASLQTLLFAPPPPPPAPAPPPPPQVVQVVKVKSEMMNNQLTAPTRIPKNIQMVAEKEAPVSSFGVAGMEGLGGGSNEMSSMFGNTAVKAAAPKKVTISAGVSQGMLLQKTVPTYPPIAKAARVQGTVVLQATISRTGTIENLTVVSGPAMLQQSAMDAVKQWRYRPYLLNNEPVEVDTTVNVIFTLGG
jgi:periplasmic protein TonB